MLGRVAWGFHVWPEGAGTTGALSRNVTHCMPRGTSAGAEGTGGAGSQGPRELSPDPKQEGGSDQQMVKQTETQEAPPPPPPNCFFPGLCAGLLTPLSDGGPSGLSFFPSVWVPHLVSHPLSQTESHTHTHTLSHPSLLLPSLGQGLAETLSVELSLVPPGGPHQPLSTQGWRHRGRRNCPGDGEPAWGQEWFSSRYGGRGPARQSD